MKDQPPPQPTKISYLSCTKKNLLHLHTHKHLLPLDKKSWVPVEVAQGKLVRGLLCITYLVNMNNEKCQANEDGLNVSEQVTTFLFSTLSINVLCATVHCLEPFLGQAVGIFTALSPHDCALFWTISSHRKITLHESLFSSRFSCR